MHCESPDERIPLGAGLLSPPANSARSPTRYSMWACNTGGICDDGQCINCAGFTAPCQNTIAHLNTPFSTLCQVPTDGCSMVGVHLMICLGQRSSLSGQLPFVFLTARRCWTLITSKVNTRRNEMATAKLGSRVCVDSSKTIGVATIESAIIEEPGSPKSVFFHDLEDVDSII